MPQVRGLEEEEDENRNFGNLSVQPMQPKPYRKFEGEQRMKLEIEVDEHIVGILKEIVVEPLGMSIEEYIGTIVRHSALGLSMYGAHAILCVGLLLPSCRGSDAKG